MGEVSPLAKIIKKNGFDLKINISALMYLFVVRPTKYILCVLQGQMDEDVQKALKQILMMCKMPNQAKEAC